MSDGGKSLATNVAFSLGSSWAGAAAGVSNTFDFSDDTATPPKPIGQVES